MTKRVLIPLAEGFEEVEAVTLVDVLRRAGVTVVTAGLRAGPMAGSHGLAVVPDTTLDAVAAESFDMMVLPGGLPGTTHLDEDPRVHALLKRLAGEEKYVAAICAAPSVLAHAGLLTGKRATSYPTCMPEELLPSMHYCDDPVVRDGRVITSRGPGTAMDFALTLSELLTSRAVRDEVEAELMRP
ncbi:MAG: DJ-1/PfpI family protein [Magnetococcales bacterium]|nr:DJ-1/PfpI family protein [Magnetococcales bacterium]